VVAHNSYLLNLSTPDKVLLKKSLEYFVGAMELCEEFGIDGLITHPGSHGGQGEAEGIGLTAATLDAVLHACKNFRTKILLENTAGQGDCIGHRFEHLKQISEST